MRARKTIKDVARWNELYVREWNGEEMYEGRENDGSRKRVRGSFMSRSKAERRIFPSLGSEDERREIKGGRDRQSNEGEMAQGNSKEKKGMRGCVRGRDGKG